ncbi:hypothetical protein KNCP2_03520 [Candidatus Rickettsia kedanie]|uniref:Uncharacterized protein n=2 Tax=spotted fever group TaxID=114277 RepID=H8K9M7_RICAC|nr:hypothetical protein MC5_01775 [Rickettsia australis str. Cutlack]
MTFKQYGKAASDIEPIISVVYFASDNWYGTVKKIKLNVRPEIKPKSKIPIKYNFLYTEYNYL